MSLPTLSVKRPVMAVMISAAIVIFGLISYFSVGIQANPNITYPVISVNTDLPGGDPEVINETITKPIEAALNTIAGVKNINSTSSPGTSSIELKFALGTNMDAAFNEVQSKMNQVFGLFPTGTRPPIIQKNSSSGSPVMLVGIYGNQSLEELDNLARNVVQKRLQGLPGVAEVSVVGAQETQVMVELNLAKMASLNISPAMVKEAFASQHIQMPGGFVLAGKRQYSLNLDFEFHSLQALKNMVIAYKEGAPVYLKEIATIQLAVPDRANAATLNGKTALGVEIIKFPTANTVEVVEGVKERLEQIQKALPEGVSTQVVFEEAHYILSVVHELEEDTILSIFAAGLVIWLFLRNMRSTLIIVTAIPVSLLGAVLAIYFFGYTLNIITLLGIILLVGVVVDDAIVVLENIYRQMEENHLGSKEATISGSNQVVFAVMAATLSLVSIFLPVIFMGGTLGLFFKSFAVVVTAGVLISLLVSLTLTPVLCANFLRIVNNHGSVYLFLEKFFLSLDRKYKKLLHFSLRFRWLMVVIAVLTIAVSLPVVMVIGKGMMPEDSETGHFQIFIQTTQGSSSDYTKSRVMAAEKVLAKTPEVESFFAYLRKPNMAMINVNLVPEEERNTPQTETMQAVQAELKMIPGGMFIVSSSQAGGSMTFELHGEDYKETIRQAQLLSSILNNDKDVGPVYIHLSSNQPEYQLNIERDLASSLGISAEEVASAAMILSSQGIRVGKFNRSGGNQRYNIVIKADESQFVTGEDLTQIYLHNQKGKPVSLDTITSFSSKTAPLEITRANQNYSVGFNASPKISLNKAIDKIESIADEILLPGYEVVMTGDTEALGKTEKSLGFTLVLILIMMYIVLASQFNSFIQPLIIMVAQPLALIGGVLVLWLTGQTLNIYSMIGALLLMGLVAKNSILLIDLTNQMRESGFSIRDALLEACPLRMRPVVMTSSAIILAMLPAAIMPGEASSSHRPLALVIIGGMISSTFLTLVIVPAIYSLIENGKKRVLGSRKIPDSNVAPNETDLL
ncbi:multidrug efflux transporter (plasmid) [Legionella adelaidensis]|uniref:Multidrug efflux transporter n=1 Tax=Legionella adelaidensis TaxID=45056 RepID=A0A0W0R1U4_9GAMM|nr:efflux RND transporter permease subunit [Legionella adelaidensis]KTC65060.1 multidrug efflux transporter [Legionella adelaidensis]VEH85420.1 multidrug efflux transporter [Legionella adelaidensis]